MQEQTSRNALRKLLSALAEKTELRWHVSHGFGQKRHFPGFCTGKFSGARPGTPGALWRVIIFNMCKLRKRNLHTGKTEKILRRKDSGIWKAKILPEKTAATVYLSVQTAPGRKETRLERNQAGMGPAHPAGHQDLSLAGKGQNRRRSGTGLLSRLPLPEPGSAAEGPAPPFWRPQKRGRPERRRTGHRPSL